MSSEFYINKSVHYLINKRIHEYDIVSAGLTTLKDTGIISETTYHLWKQRPKDWVVRHIGLRLGKTFQETNAHITETISKFISVNEIPDTAIISRKRDAVFIFNHPIITLEIDGFQLKLKNSYTSYFKLESYELYYNSATDILSIKGIDTRFVKNHPLISRIKKCIRLYEKLDQNFISYKEVYTYIHSLKNEYCSYKLPLDCYREIDYENPFTVYDKQEKRMDKYTVLPNGDRYELVINYNFVRFIVPFIRLLAKYRYKANKTG
jgi:hypothetical protein